MTPFKLERLGMIMEPQSGEPNEVEGVLNPAAVRGPDGQLYLFPRLVARGNYSRIGIARVLFDKVGDPIGVERMGLALEPEADYELTDNGGGCEDARVSFVEPLKLYVMTYTALSRHGPRIAIAVSEDLFQWRRLGLARFEPYKSIGFEDVDNKDACIFPAAFIGPSGKPVLALLHRPLFPGTRPEEKVDQPAHRKAHLHHESIWISYCELPANGELAHLGAFGAHHRLASPVSAWEKLKIGCGAPPILCRHGWLGVYHGVHCMPPTSRRASRLCYSAGVMVLPTVRSTDILYRSPDPILVPHGPYETHGTVDDVVFPTGVDRRDDLGAPDVFDVYYGMADDRIGVARMHVPKTLPPGAPADPGGAAVKAEA
jgi:predicted GH43/DUF377 family glycosyl hydrolase